MKKSRLIPLLTGAAAVAAVTGGAALASTSTSHTATVSASTVAQVSATSGQSVGGALDGGSAATAATAKADAALSAYWTPARMRHARSADPTSAQPSKSAQLALADHGAPESVAPAVPAGQASPAAAAASGSRAAGKVFFSDDGADWVCSGSVIRSHRLNVVSTAGHCVIDARANHYHYNWAFVPDYRNGSAPYGVWGGAYARTTVGWAKHGDFDYDAAFVNVHDLNRRHLQNVVGGEGILINQGYKPYVTVIGYPAAAPYNGATQQFCYGYTHRYYKTGEIELGCHLTGGASGGPWLRWFSKGYGYVDGVSSNKNSNNNRDVRSPYFGSWTWKLYKQSA